MSKEAAINDVVDTAYWVAYFRAKETANAKPLFIDPFAKMLIGSRGKAIVDATPKISRYAEWTVLARTVIIDRFIQQLINDGIDAVINLGAGLDARPYRMNLPKDLLWIEVDYPKTIEHKKDVLKSETPKCLLRSVALDLSDTEKRKEFLNSVAADSKNVLILTEGVVPYLSPNDVAVLAQELFSQGRFTYWAVEYIHNSVYPHLKAAARSGELKNSPFRFFPDEWSSFFAKFGWVEKETRYFGEIAVEFGRKIPLPKIAELLMWLLPKKIKEQAFRSSGFVLFKRKIA